MELETVSYFENLLNTPIYYNLNNCTAQLPTDYETG